jgi:hypothetical protein
VSYEIVRTAAEAFSLPGGPGDARTAAQRRMDGLVAACKAALDGGTAPARHGTAPHITILVKDETLAQAATWTASTGQAPGTGQRASTGLVPGAGQASGQADSAAPALAASTPSGLITGAPPGRTGHGTLLTARQVLALCCGAQISAIRWDNGLPLNAGRTMRTEPPGLRRALEARDRGCRWPSCDAPAAWATAHHLTPWSHGGATTLAGLALLCHLHHHHFIHTLGWTITGNPNHTLHFTHPGRWLTLHSPLPGAEEAERGGQVRRRVA